MPDSQETNSEEYAQLQLPPIRPLSWLRQKLGDYIPEDVWYNWKWDALAGFFAGIYTGSTWLFAFQLARGELHATKQQMGFAVSAQAIGFLFVIFWARQMEGRAKLPFVTITWTISRGLFLLTPLLVQGAHRTLAFMAILCAAPILFSVSMPAYTSIMKDIYPDNLRGRMMSYVRLGLFSSMLVTSLLMGFLLEKHYLDFRWMFVIGGVFGVGTAWAFSHLRLPAPEVIADPPPVFQFLKQTFGILAHNKGYRWFTISVFLSGFGNLVAGTYYPIHQVDIFHITPTQIAIAGFVFNTSSLISLFFWGRFLDKHGSLSSVLLALFINCLAPLLYAFGNNLSWIYAATAFIGFSQAGVDLGYLNTTLMFAEPGRAAQYQALHSTFFGIRGTIAPLLAIPILALCRHEIKLAFLVCLLIMGVGVASQLISLRTFRSQQMHAHDVEEEINE